MKINFKRIALVVSVLLLGSRVAWPGSSTSGTYGTIHGQPTLTIDNNGHSLTFPSTYGGQVCTLAGAETLSGKTFGQALVPSATATYDLGATATRWANLWLSGNATITGSLSASNLSGSCSGTNTGDITLGTANGLSLTGQALSLGLASGTAAGALSSADWTTFSGKQAAGNYVTGLTGDVSASGPGSVAATVIAVGGSTSSNVHAAELLANAATATNTANAIARRDANGNVGHSSITFSQITTPSSPSASQTKVYCKSDGKCYTLDSSGTETAIGSGSGGSKNYLAGYNGNPGNGDIEKNSTTNFSLGHVSLDSNKLPTGAPTLGSGADAHLSLSVVSSGALAGKYSLAYGTTTAFVAGDFVATDVITIDPEDEGKNLQLQFSNELWSGLSQNGSNFNLTDTNANTFGIAVWDVTDAKWIFPNDTWNLTVGSGVGNVSTWFTSTTTSAQYRLVLYNANASSGTGSAAWLDSFLVGPNATTVNSFAGTGVVAYTPTLGGTTASTNLAWFQRLGPSLHVWGQFTASAAGAASPFTVPLPSGLNIDTTATGGGQKDVFGRLWRATSASNQFAGTAVGPFPLVGSLASSTSQVYISLTATSDVFGAANASAFIASGDVFSYDFTVPIAGFSSNVVVAPSSTYWISAYMVNAGRVTGSAPTQLGQYRSYLKNASSRTYTETNGAPSTSPTSSDGVFIWGGPQYSSADPSNNPSRYDIFIGKNKSYIVQAYSSTGKSGALDIKLMPGWAGADDVGLETAYDPSTGVLTVLCPRQGTTGITGAIGLDNNGVAVNNGYFDVKVSDNALFVASSVTGGGAVTSTTTGQEHIERAFFAGNAAGTSNCTSTPCTIVGQTGSWVTSVSHSSTGIYVVNIASGEFNTTPFCWCNSDNALAGAQCQYTYSLSSLTTANIVLKSTAGALNDGGAEVYCMGPH